MSRRRENLVIKSSSVKSREGIFELGSACAPFLYPSGDARAEHWMHSGWSLSPHHTVEGTRSTARDIRCNSPKKMEYQWPVGRGQGGGVQSRLSPTQRVHERPHVTGRVLGVSPPPTELHGKYECPEYLDYTDYETNTRLKRVHNYDDHTQPNKESYTDRKLMAADDRETLVEDTMPMEDNTVKIMVRLHPDSEFASDYRETRRCFSTMEARGFGDDSNRYQDVIPSQKPLVKGYHEGREKYAYHSRNVPCPFSLTSQFKDLGHKHLIKGKPSTSSSVIMRGVFLGSRPDVSASPNDDYEKVIGILGCNEYGQKPCMDTRRDCEGLMDIKCQPCDIYHNNGAGCEDYLYSNLKVIGNYSNHGHINHDGFYEKRPLYVQEDHDHRDLARATTVDPRIEKTTEAESSHRILRNSSNDRWTNAAETGGLMWCKISEFKKSLLES
ncbi:hypothetical protein Ancab_000126 [Ancistrocladus abbreviatus]